MASTDARPIPRKNTAYRVTFPLYDADGDLVTGATSLDSEVSIDGGTFADCTNEATEIATASGMYYLDLTAAEMNGDTIAVIVKSGTAKTLPLVFYPEELGDVRVDVGMISGDSGAADNLEAALDGSGGVDLTLRKITVTATSNDSALTLTGSGSGHGFIATGGATGAGIRAIGGGTSGAGVHASGTAGNSAGATFAGQGSASGLNATGGATGHGIRGVGGATSGDGMNLSAPTAGDGLEAVGAGGGYDVNADIQGALSGAVGSVTAGVNATQINSSANAAARLALSAAQMIPGTVDNTAHTPTITVFEADDITEATADHYNGRLILWTSGALVGQVTDVTDYALSSGRGRFTVTAMTEAPANNDTFILV